MPIEGAWIRTCTVDPTITFLVLRAEDLFAFAVIALNPVVRAVVEELGFALLGLAEGLVRDKHATTTIA